MNRIGIFFVTNNGHVGKVEIVRINNPKDKEYCQSFYWTPVSEGKEEKHCEYWAVSAYIGDKTEIVLSPEEYRDFEFDFSYFLQVDGVDVEELLYVPLWCCRFSTDLFNWILKITGSAGGIKKIVSIKVDQPVRSTGYLGVKCYSQYGWKGDDKDEFANSRIKFGLFAAEIDPLNVRLKRCLVAFNQKGFSQKEKLGLGRMALTLLDSDGKFIFASANSDETVANAALEMEGKLVCRKAESFTSFLIKEKISSPISINYSVSDGIFILYRSKRYQVKIDENFDGAEILCDSSQMDFDVINSSHSHQIGLIENAQFVKKCGRNTSGASLFFYPVNHGVCIAPFPAFVLFLVVGDCASQFGRRIESSLFPKVRAYFSAALTIESTILLNGARVLACKSAIGSIMSRNGSHNIGSHVLAALSHNVGTMPDDRVLYQYIQHRMDYIATVTTDMPKWRQPMMFVGDLIKNFLSQRHLLDHIAGSEGLKAWQFQNTHADNRHCLKFHVRRMKCEEGVRTVDYDFIAYPEEKNNPENPCDKKITEKKKGEIDLANDIALAIPGGVVGQHAFFTILENIIRNAAKHDWAVLHPVTDKPTSDDDNLDVFIEFEDMPDAGVVEFVIYSSKSFAMAKDETDKDFDLCARQNERFAASLIDDQGALRRENWGLAEMKISAGYLQSREISEIGGLGVESDKTKKDQAKYGTIIEAVAINTIQGKNDQWEITDRCDGYLGYRFKVPKPRTLLLVTESTESKDAITEAKRVQLQKEGLYILEKSELNGRDDLSYEFVLLPSFVESECKDWRLPFRLITMTSDDNWPLAKDLLARWDMASEDFGDRTKHESNVYTTVEKVVEDLCSGELAPSELKNHIAACWTRYMLQRRPDIKGTLNLIVAPTIGNDGTSNQSGSQKSDGSGKSLINPASAVAYVFEEGFDNAVDSYLKLEGVSDTSGQEKKSVYVILTALKGMKQRRVDDEIRQSEADYEPIICLQLLKWTKILGGADREIVAYLEARSCLSAQPELKSVDEKIADVEKRLRDAGLTDSDFANDKDWSKLKFQRGEILRRARRASISANHSFSHFISYFVEVCSQAKGYLGKYAENIPTLPKGYEIRTGSGTVSSGQIVAAEWPAADLMVCHGNSDCKDAPSVRYIRHFEQKEGVSRTDRDHVPEFVKKPFAGFAGSVHYVEGLSGTQSYLSQLLLLDLYNRCYQSKLVENALMRLLIVDERVSRFIKEHSDIMLATYKRMEITVADETLVSSDANLRLPQVADLPTGAGTDSVCQYTPRGLLRINPKHIDYLRGLVERYSLDERHDKLGGFDEEFKPTEAGHDFYHHHFDVLIIHQGIIDKWFPNIAHDQKKIDLLFYGLRHVFPYVVITTGRGTPANVPTMARVLPFSTIETTMFKKYPEKLVLVDAIMNLLPIRKT